MNHTPDKTPDTFFPEIDRLLRELKAPSTHALPPIIRTESENIVVDGVLHQLLHEITTHFFTSSYHTTPASEKERKMLEMDMIEEEADYFYKLEELLFLGRTSAVTAFARYQGKNGKHSDLNGFFLSMLKDLDKSLIQPLVDSARRTNMWESYEPVAAYRTYYFLLWPTVAQWFHAFVFEWFIQGGEKDRFLQQTEYRQYSFHRKSFEHLYGTMLETHQRYHKLFGRVVRPEHIQKEMEEQQHLAQALRNKYPKKRLPFQGYIEQEVALSRLRKQGKMQETFRNHLLFILHAAQNGSLLPNVMHTVTDEEGSYTIELLHTAGRHWRSQGYKNPKVILRISPDAQAPTALRMWPKDRNKAYLQSDKHSYLLIQEQGLALLPRELLRGFSEEGKERALEPQITLFDLCRSYTGALAWLEEILLPAMQSLENLYLEAEVFENSDAFVDQLATTARSVIEPIHEEILPVDKEAAHEEIAHIAPLPALDDHQPTIFYDALEKEVFYLRATKSHRANADSAERYRNLTGKELPHGYILCSIPYSESSVTWQQVERILLQHFLLEKDRQTGSHMQYFRTVQTENGDERFRATILAHYQDQAKPKTLVSVLNALRIPAALFWILHSKTYKRARILKQDIKQLCQTIATNIAEATHEKRSELPEGN